MGLNQYLLFTQNVWKKILPTNTKYTRKPLIKKNIPGDMDHLRHNWHGSFTSYL